MSWRYLRLFLIALFVWAAVLGLKSASWRMVIVPFLALGALFIVREKLSETFPKYGEQLGGALVTLILLYNLYFTIPALRSWLASQFPQATAATDQLRADADLRAAERLGSPDLPARKALHEYLLRKEDIVARNITTQLDALNVKRQQGTFGQDDEKKEKEVINQFQKLVRDRRELQQLIAGTAVDELSKGASPAPSSQPRYSPQQDTPSKASSDVVADPKPVGNADSLQPPKQLSNVVATPLPEAKGKTLIPSFPTEGQPAEYNISLQQCVRNSEEINCWGYIKNLTDGTFKLRMNHTYSTFIDDEGNAGNFISSVATERFIPGVLVRYEFSFHDSHRNVKMLSFELKTLIEGDPSPRYRGDTFTFKDVSLQ
jgi:hypothetical protein